jgi:hydroxyacylglutathione hydrolase
MAVYNVMATVNNLAGRLNMDDFHFERKNVGIFDTNCYFIICGKTKEVAIIDPGACGHQIVAKMGLAGWKPTMILNTHGHWDHIGDNKYVQEAFDIPIFIHEADLPCLSDKQLSMADWMSEDGSYDGGSCDQPLMGGETLKLGDIDIQVIHTPGHSPGSVAFYLPQHDLVFSGDTLYDCCIGCVEIPKEEQIAMFGVKLRLIGPTTKEDLPNADCELLIKSIKEKLFLLPDQTMVHPGHGAKTSIDYEKKFNPYTKEAKA